MTIHLIPLDQIDPNPFQPREREDPAHVERVARSIEREGLLQEPLARVVGERYQLAFGHTRVAAYRWLDPVELGYDKVPLKLAELTDLQMFELAVRENSERKDLTPIEEARAMAVYRDTFEKSSEEIGALFGLAGSTVRNKLRLLDLPDAVQERVSEGVLSEGTARSLLTVQKIVPDQVDRIAESLAEGGYTNPESVAGAIKGQLRGRANALEMWSGSYSEGVPCAGKGLWGFDWKPDGLLPLTKGRFLKVFSRYADALNISKHFNTLMQAFEFGDGDLEPQDLMIVYELDLQFITDALQLARPPACNRCEYYARLDGSHWCGLKGCYSRKKAAWLRAETERLSAALGIPIYDPRADGRDYESPESYQKAAIEKYKTWLAEGADHLRLKARYSDWRAHPLTDSYAVQLVSVREEVRAAAEDSRKSAAQREKEDRNRHQRWEIERKKAELVNAFLWEVASQVFAPAFECVSKAVLPDLVGAVFQNDRYKDDLPEDPQARLGYYRRHLARAVVGSFFDYPAKKLGAAHVAGHLAGVALTWGVPLPADWAEIAQGYEVGPDGVGVSTETAE